MLIAQSKKIFKLFLKKIFTFSLTQFYLTKFYVDRLFRGETLKQASIETIASLSARSVAIFAYYPSQNDAWVERQLNELAYNDFDIVFVSNQHLTKAQRESFLSHINVLIERPNIGRDFGCYRDGFLYLEQINHLIKIENLLFINDTILFPIGDTTNYWKDLISLTQQVVGPYENFTYGRHIQSFFILLRQNSFNHPAIKAFWENYKPLDYRWYAIHYGEIKFSKVMNDCGISFGALCTPAYFFRYIHDSLPLELLHDYANLLELDYEQFAKHLSGKTITFKISKKISEFYSSVNLTHPLGLFMLALGIPMLKKDLLKRGSILPGDIFLLPSIDHQTKEQIMIALLRSKLPIEKNFINRLTDYLEIT